MLSPPRRRAAAAARIPPWSRGSLAKALVCLVLILAVVVYILPATRKHKHEGASTDRIRRRDHREHGAPQPPATGRPYLQCILRKRRLAVRYKGELHGGSCARLHHGRVASKLAAATTAKVFFEDCREALKRQDQLPEQHPAVSALQRTTVNLRPGSTDHKVFGQVWCTGDWDVLKALEPFFADGQPVQVLDAGANVGLASIMLAAFIRYNGAITAIEGSPDTSLILRKNLAALPIATPVEAALVPADQAGLSVVFGGGKKQGMFWNNRILPAKSFGRAANASSTGDSAASTVTARGDASHNRSTSSAEAASSSTMAAGAGADAGGTATGAPVWQGVPERTVTTTSLVQLVERVPGKRFDFIKLDIEGYELHLFKDPASVEVLCRARCIMAELHDHLHFPGLFGINDAWTAFRRDGCGPGVRFKVVGRSGEHVAACRNDTSASGLQGL